LSLATWGVRNLGVQSPTTQQRNGPGGGFRAREGKVRGKGQLALSGPSPGAGPGNLDTNPVPWGCSQELLSPAG
jgi:hypothetical protein